MNELTLNNLNQAKELIVQANFSQLKEIIARADALKVYAAQAKKGLEIQNQVAEIKLRAEKRIGELLKTDIKQGGDRTARSQVVTLKDLGIDKMQSHRWQQVASLPDKQFEEHLANIKASNEELTTVGVIKLVKELNNTFIKFEPLAPAIGKYQCIVIDPPWNYGTEYNSGTRRVASPYPEIPTEELKKFNLPADKNCILWLWTTHKFLPDAFELMKIWDFEYKLTFVWDKQKMGMGSWLRCQTEFCLLGIKGKPQWNLTNERDILPVARREHSRKPDEFYKMVEKLCPTKYKIDIFSREKRNNFDQYGNEPNKLGR